MTRINQKAFSLIEVMVVLVVMTMAGLGLIELINSNLRAQKGVQNSSELNQFSTTLQQLMGSQNICTADLSGTTFDPSLAALQATAIEIDYPKVGATPGTIVPDPSNRFVRAGDSYGGWNVTSMGLRKIAPGGISNSYFANVEVNFQKKKDGSGNLISLGSSTGQRLSQILVTVDASNKIISCGSVTTTGPQFLSATSFVAGDVATFADMTNYTGGLNWNTFTPDNPPGSGIPGWKTYKPNIPSGAAAVMLQIRTWSGSTGDKSRVIGRANSSSPSLSLGSAVVGQGTSNAVLPLNTDGTFQWVVVNPQGVGGLEISTIGYY